MLRFVEHVIFHAVSRLSCTGGICRARLRGISLSLLGVTVSARLACIQFPRDRTDSVNDLQKRRHASTAPQWNVTSPSHLPRMLLVDSPQIITRGILFGASRESVAPTLSQPPKASQQRGDWRHVTW